jgi:hypothetical protein
MGKSELTLDIERCLINNAVKNSKRYANEVPVEGGICDFVEVKIDFKNNNIPTVYCYEIKVTLNDFKSKNGHNFIGDYNYYVIPIELYKILLEKQLIPKYKNYGIITYDKTLKIIEKSKKSYRPKSVDSKLQLLDSMLMRWCRGGMTNLLETINYELPTVTLSKERKEMKKRYKELYPND